MSIKTAVELFAMLRDGQNPSTMVYKTETMTLEQKEVAKALAEMMHERFPARTDPFLEAQMTLPDMGRAFIGLAIDRLQFLHEQYPVDDKELLQVIGSVKKHFGIVPRQSDHAQPEYTFKF